MSVDSVLQLFGMGDHRTTLLRGREGTTIMWRAGRIDFEENINQSLVTLQQLLTAVLICFKKLIEV